MALSDDTIRGDVGHQRENWQRWQPNRHLAGFPDFGLLAIRLSMLPAISRVTLVDGVLMDRGGRRRQRQ
ncbi:hypothetical protein [Actinoplanes campanulatus]|uniref:hypothetical protein n=1 Tax=Actinoplanes campanulatus TaxID=113559 RepID=UPI001953ECDE|nr:hypothetical protein [Actinoplanes capillaceus]